LLEDNKVAAQKKKSKNTTDIPPVTAYLLAFIDTLILLIALFCFVFFSIFGDPSYNAGYWVPALLMAPVIGWVIFAAYLNLAAMVVDK
jgi:uncharacterized membrane protein (DUF485 family)